MNFLQALILGIIQGITEFLPISSSGHLELGHKILGIANEDNLLFAVTVHAATVMSTIIIFKNDIKNLLIDLWKFKWNDSLKYILLLFFSAVPVVIIGLFFEDKIDLFFQGQLRFVGLMLILTGLLLTLTVLIKHRKKNITFSKSFLIGIAQAFAVLPGISRSGATIATGLLLGIKREEIAKFSFLMVIIPIGGAFFYDLINGDFSTTQLNPVFLLIGFISAFFSGLFACRIMLRMVKNGKLFYFAIYCFIIGLIAIFAA